MVGKLASFDTHACHGPKAKGLEKQVSVNVQRDSELASVILC
jgi:hypothetical protein